MEPMSEILNRANETYNAAVAERDELQGKYGAEKTRADAVSAAYEELAAKVDATNTRAQAAEGERDAARFEAAELKRRLDELERPAGELIDVDTFRERLAPAFFRFASLPADSPVRNKWSVIINNFLPPTRTTPINRASPATQGMVGSLVADELLTQQEADYALSPA